MVPDGACRRRKRRTRPARLGRGRKPKRAAQGRARPRDAGVRRPGQRGTRPSWSSSSSPGTDTHGEAATDRGPRRRLGGRLRRPRPAGLGVTPRRRRLARPPPRGRRAASPRLGDALALRGLRWAEPLGDHTVPQPAVADGQDSWPVEREDRCGRCTPRQGSPRPGPAAGRRSRAARPPSGSGRPRSAGRPRPRP